MGRSMQLYHSCNEVKDDVQVHYCWACDRLHVAGRFASCHGPYHQFRNSMCHHAVVFHDGVVDLGMHAYDTQLAKRVQGVADEEIARRARPMEEQVRDQFQCEVVGVAAGAA